MSVLMLISQWFRNFLSKRISPKFLRFLFFVGTLGLAICSWLDFWELVNFSNLDLLSYVFLFVTLYQLDVHRKVTLPNRLRIPKSIKTLLPRLIVASTGLFVYFSIDYTFRIFELAADTISSINLEIFAGPILLMIMLVILLQFGRHYYFPSLKFTSKISENQYIDTLNGIGIICMFLGAGGDLLTDSAMFTAAFLHLHPLKESQKLEWKFWVKIWQRRESALNEMISSSAFIFGIFSLAFNFRFIVRENPLQWIFIIFCLIPMITAYAKRPQRRMALISVTIQVVTIFCSWIWIIIFPSALPLGSQIHDIVAQELINPPPAWIMTAPVYFWIVFSTTLLVTIALSACTYVIRKNVAGKSVILELLQHLVLIAFLSSILEFVLSEKLISSLLIPQEIPGGYYQASFLSLSYINYSGIIIGMVVLLSLFSAIDTTLTLLKFRQFAQKRHLTLNKKKTFVLGLIVSIFFSAGMMTLDIIVMTSNKSSYYSHGKVSLTGNFTYTSIPVIGVVDEIALNVVYPANYTLWGQVLTSHFGYPYERTNCTGGRSRIVFKPLFSGDFYVEFGLYGLAEDSLVDVSFNIERGRPSVASGGPLYYFPVYNFLLLVPVLYVIITISKEPLRRPA